MPLAFDGGGERVVSLPWIGGNEKDIGLAASAILNYDGG
jgi:hypothetical protein